MSEDDLRNFNAKKGRGKATFTIASGPSVESLSSQKVEDENSEDASINHLKVSLIVFI